MGKQSESDFCPLHTCQGCDRDKKNKLDRYCDFCRLRTQLHAEAQRMGDTYKEDLKRDEAWESRRANRSRNMTAAQIAGREARQRARRYLASSSATPASPTPTEPLTPSELLLHRRRLTHGVRTPPALAAL